ncbi:carboxymuconolactone decarboxylase family protein [Microbacterium album]|uniref:Carboxymuconolactone decarboxylase-like domain-containing protein n=1 Tax=Microbacterium album TaxID=2053191 RepID=A0A917II67_9MICO|nr:carboxymuconolactone decarboxylase family protein [Microbacterium album]GGH48488.1 hypothetical protein GCM10010921_25980 [Microbacterium album]
MTDTETELTDRARSAADYFRKERGFIAEPFEIMARADPDFLVSYTDFSMAPWRTGPLEPKVKELVYVAIDAAVNHMHEVGTLNHARSALAQGATREELVSVFEIVSLLGLQTLELGVTALERALGEEPGDDDWMERLARFDPAGAQSARAWYESVVASSPLEPKIIELIGVAVNASTCHLNEAATARHIRAALAAGATRAEIAEVFQLVSVLGIHSATLAFPLLEELAQ